MTTHELKLDIKYFDDVKSGKKNFEIRKNDRDFQVGDILKLRAWKPKNSNILTDTASYAFEHDDPIAIEIWSRCDIEQADTITVRVKKIYDADEYNHLNELAFSKYPNMEHHGISSQEIGGFPMIRLEETNKLLKDYFHTDRLPDDYVVLGIEVIE